MGHLANGISNAPCYVKNKLYNGLWFFLNLFGKSFQAYAYLITYAYSRIHLVSFWPTSMQNPIFKNDCLWINYFCRTQIGEGEFQICWLAKRRFKILKSKAKCFLKSLFRKYFVSEWTSDQLDISSTFLSSLLGGFAVVLLFCRKWWQKCWRNVQLIRGSFGKEIPTTYF